MGGYNMKQSTYEAVINLLEKTCGLDNMVILKDNKMTVYGSAKMDDDFNYIVNKKEVKENTRQDLKGYEMVLFYDGGYMYSIMSAEYGYESRDNFEGELIEILEKDGLYYDFQDNVTMVIYKD
jgi:hypothetical protein